ncbi:unnamed protein product [Amoebophrya sp. A25]|nr:unnamed protein product [Amoebophrya sp. A25]|eukprot:GSA25T00011159001.1
MTKSSVLAQLKAAQVRLIAAAESLCDNLCSQRTRLVGGSVSQFVQKTSQNFADSLGIREVVLAFVTGWVLCVSVVPLALFAIVWAWIGKKASDWCDWVLCPFRAGRFSKNRDSNSATSGFPEQHNACDGMIAGRCRDCPRVESSRSCEDDVALSSRGGCSVTLFGISACSTSPPPSCSGSLEGFSDCSDEASDFVHSCSEDYTDDDDCPLSFSDIDEDATISMTVLEEQDVVLEGGRHVSRYTRSGSWDNTTTTATSSRSTTGTVDEEHAAERALSSSNDKSVTVVGCFSKNHEQNTCASPGKQNKTLLSRLVQQCFSRTPDEDEQRAHFAVPTGASSTGANSKKRPVISIEFLQKSIPARFVSMLLGKSPRAFSGGLSCSLLRTPRRFLQGIHNCLASIRNIKDRIFVRSRVFASPASSFNRIRTSKRTTTVDRSCSKDDDEMGAFARESVSQPQDRDPAHRSSTFSRTITPLIDVDESTIDVGSSWKNIRATAKRRSILLQGSHHDHDDDRNWQDKCGSDADDDHATVPAKARPPSCSPTRRPQLGRRFLYPSLANERTSGLKAPRFCGRDHPLSRATSGHTTSTSTTIAASSSSFSTNESSVSGPLGAFSSPLSMSQTLSSLSQPTPFRSQGKQLRRSKSNLSDLLQSSMCQHKKSSNLNNVLHTQRQRNGLHPLAEGEPESLLFTANA